MPRNDITTLVWDGPCAVTESHCGIAIGYYTDCDTAHCRDCIPDADVWARGDYTGWPGFEGWEAPAVIFNDTESDTPTHCGKCGAVIQHDLTAEGAHYVRDAIAEFIAGDGHTPDVMAQWWDAYGENEYALNRDDLALILGTVMSPSDELDESGMRELIRRAMAEHGCAEYVGCAVCHAMLERVDVNGPDEYVHAGDEPADGHTPVLPDNAYLLLRR
jgi:hypothetical protein